MKTRRLNGRFVAFLTANIFCLAISSFVQIEILKILENLGGTLQWQVATQHRGRICASYTDAPGSILDIPDDLFLLEIYSLHVAEIHYLHWTAQNNERTVQQLINADRIHLVLLDRR